MLDLRAGQAPHHLAHVGLDHGLLTHLARYILSEIDIAPRALVVSTREQLEGKTGNTSGFPLPAILDGLE